MLQWLDQIHNLSCIITQHQGRSKACQVGLKELQATAQGATQIVERSRHRTYLSNSILVKRKNRQIRFCIDYRDLNKACPKDVSAIIISSRQTSQLLRRSLLNSHRQLPQATPTGNFHYTIMSFSFKNTSATYHWAMIAIFHGVLYN